MAAAQGTRLPQTASLTTCLLAQPRATDTGFRSQRRSGEGCSPVAALEHTHRAHHARPTSHPSPEAVAPGSVADKSQVFHSDWNFGLSNAETKGMKRLTFNRRQRRPPAKLLHET